eukprot:908169-Rhodomonas_salina.1
MMMLLLMLLMLMLMLPMLRMRGVGGEACLLEVFDAREQLLQIDSHLLRHRTDAHISSTPPGACTVSSDTASFAIDNDLLCSMSGIGAWKAYPEGGADFLDVLGVEAVLEHLRHLSLQRWEGRLDPHTRASASMEGERWMDEREDGKGDWKEKMEGRWKGEEE